MLKVALCQLNFKIGDFENNLQKILSHIEQAKLQKSDLVIFSELAVCGYPPYDLLFDDTFVNNSLKAIDEIVKYSYGITIVVGGVDINNEKGKKLYNTAFIIKDGQIVQKYYKSLLPSYDIFYETRYFEPGFKPVIFKLKNQKIAVTICEDIWTNDTDNEPSIGKPVYSFNPLENYKPYKPDILINLAASPFSYEQISHRYDVLQSVQRFLGCKILYVNQVGAQTDIIFDGGSAFLDNKGIYKLKFFEEDFKIIDLEKPEYNDTKIDKIESIYKALLLGIRDFLHKTGQKKVVVGLSGGIDSSVVTLLAADAIGSENVFAMLMPSRYSSEHSITDSIELCKRNNIAYSIISIEPVFEQFESQLAPVFYGKQTDITEENIQARIRAVYLMAYANKNSCVLLNTSNKSEVATGYGTLYGDMCGAISVLGDVYKTQVYELAKFLNKENERIPINIILKPPSAELKHNQKDTDTLPDYEILDKILFYFIEKMQSKDYVINLGFPAEVVNKVYNMLNYYDYKRFQAPPILRISNKSFGVGRIFPIVKK